MFNDLLESVATYFQYPQYSQYSKYPQYSQYPRYSQYPQYSQLYPGPEYRSYPAVPATPEAVLPSPTLETQAAPQPQPVFSLNNLVSIQDPPQDLVLPIFQDPPQDLVLPIFQDLPQDSQQEDEGIVRAVVEPIPPIPEPSASSTSVVVDPTLPSPPSPLSPSAEVSSQFHAQDEFGNHEYGYNNVNSAKHEVSQALMV